jgi:hypothetical protein
MLATNFESQNSTHKKPFGKVDVVLKDKHGLLVHHFAKGNGNVFNRQL